MSVRLALLAGVSLALTGCGGEGGGTSKSKSETVQLDDIGLIKNVISEVGDNPPNLLGKFFAEKKSATELAKYKNYAYVIEDKPSVEGTTATAKVKITSNKDGKEVGTKEWTFSKEGSEWKVKTAPLQ